MIVARRPGVADAAAAGQATIGLRCPAHPVAHALLAKAARAPASPASPRRARTASAASARRPRRTSSTSSATTLLVLDGGATRIGIESAIVDCSTRPAGAAAPGHPDAASGSRTPPASRSPAPTPPRRAPPARSPRTTRRRAKLRLMPTEMLRTALEVLGAEPAEAGGIFPVGAFRRRPRRRAPAHAGAARAGGARIVFDPARTRPRGRASDLGRRAAARSRMGRGSRSAQPRRGILTRSSAILEPFGMTVNCESKAPARARRLRRWPRRCWWPPAAAAAADDALPPDPDHRLRRRDEHHRRHSTTTPTAASSASTRRCRRPTRRSSAASTRSGSRASRRAYGLVFPECNPGRDRGDRAGRAASAPPLGARAADLAAQIDAQQAESPLGAGDMVTVLVGVNDVIAQYQQYPTHERGRADRQRRGRGRARSAARSTASPTPAPRCCVSTIPDIGFTPFALAERAAHADTDRGALLSRLIAALQRLAARDDRQRRPQDRPDPARRAGRQVVKFPGSNGITNATDAVCDLTQSQLTPPSILDCTAQTLVPGGSHAPIFWADDRHLSASGAEHASAAPRSRAPRTTRSEVAAPGVRAARPARCGRERAARRSPPIRRSPRAPAAPRSAFGVVDDGDDDVAPARVGEHVAGDADDVAQRPGLQVGAAGRRPSSGAACRRCRRPAASSSARA